MEKIIINDFLNQSPHEYQNMRPGLARMRLILQQMGLVKLPFKSILVAGTNGKGSVARMLELALRLQGFNVGLYTSPHLFKFNERICVLGEEIATETIEKILLKLFNLNIMDAQGQGMDAGEGRPTFFELATALAFQHFVDQQIDIAVLEVGLGGRLDATNVVDPLAAILVSIGHDHMEILGDTLEKVCYEKMGVFRENGINIVGELQAELEDFIKNSFPKDSLFFLREEQGHKLVKELFVQPCQQHNARLVALVMDVIANKIINVIQSDYHVTLSGSEGPSFRDFHIEGSSLLALNDMIDEWKRQLILPARYEKRKNFILDGAHNPEAAQALVDSLRKEFSNQKFVFIIGMVKGKNHLAFVEILEPVAKKIIFCEFDHPRSMQISDWKKLNVVTEAYVIANNIEEAKILAQKYHADLTTPIIVTGSFYWVAACSSAVL